MKKRILVESDNTGKRRYVEVEVELSELCEPDVANLEQESEDGSAD